MKLATLFAELAVIALCLTMPNAAAFALPSDDQIRKQLVGWWTTPAGNPDPFGEETEQQEVRTLERYNADGTGIVFIYSDVICGTLKITGTFHWSISQGIMQTLIPTGSRSTDRFVSIDDKAFVLRWIGDPQQRGILEHRIRATACPTKAKD